MDRIGSVRYDRLRQFAALLLSVSASRLVPHNYKSQQGENVKRKILLAGALAFSIGLTSALPAHASCGAAFCTLNTH
jgi:hypothetical protein